MKARSGDNDFDLRDGEVDTGLLLVLGLGLGMALACLSACAARGGGFERRQDPSREVAG